MIPAKFLTAFERHLLVGEPKRSEILAELKTHVGELGDADPLSFGDPKRLARTYNRTYLKFFSSRSRLLLPMPFVWIGMLIFMFIANFFGYPMSTFVNGPSADYMLPIPRAPWFSITISVLALLAGTRYVVSLGNSYRPWRTLIQSALLTVGLGSATLFLVLLPFMPGSLAEKIGGSVALALAGNVSVPSMLTLLLSGSLLFVILLQRLSLPHRQME